VAGELAKAVQRFLAATSGPERWPRLATWLVAQQRQVMLELLARQKLAARQEVAAAQQAAHEQVKAAHAAQVKLDSVGGTPCLPLLLLDGAFLSAVTGLTTAGCTCYSGAGTAQGRTELGGHAAAAAGHAARPQDGRRWRGWLLFVHWRRVVILLLLLLLLLLLHKTTQPIRLLARESFKNAISKLQNTVILLVNHIHQAAQVRIR
jgi:hypothetical protein